MTCAEPCYVRALFTALHFVHGAQADKLAQWPELLVGVIPPEQGASEERCKKRGQDERLLHNEHAAHEDDEDDDTPYKANEGDWPRLALRLIRFVEHCSQGKLSASHGL